MAKRIELEATGGPEVLKSREVSQGTPGHGQAWIEQEAIGVNFLDVTQRNGSVPIPLPSGLGLEAAGRITAVGEGVTDVAIGDRVAYALGPLGAYATGRLYPAERLVRLPDGIDFNAAAAILFKGLTAQYLLTTTYPVGPDTTILLYGAAGALGQIMVPWAKHFGGHVIGVVSKEASVERAKSAGCDDVLVWHDELADDVAKLTDGKKADVVYDPIGKPTWQASLDSLRPRGLMVSFGASGGTPPAVEVATLNAKGSLYLTRPSLAAHIGDSKEYQSRAGAVLDAVVKGIIAPSIWKAFALDDAEAAHSALESGQSQGSLILKP